MTLTPDGLATAAPDPEPTILKLVHLSPRADTDVFTMFGSFDNSNVDKGVSDGESNLAPIEDVLQMMLTQAPPSPTVFTPSSPVESSSPSNPPASLSGNSAFSVTATAVSPLATPPRQGPGIVFLSTTAHPAATATNASPEPARTSGSDNAVNGDMPSSNRMLIVGCIIGGIVFVAVLLFIMLDPSISERLCGIRRMRPFKRAKPDRGISNIADPSFSKRSLDLPGSPDRTIVGILDARKASPSPEKGGDDTLVDVDLNSHDPPASKFSICSSDYLSASTRDSGATTSSIGASTRAARPSVVTFASPTRPPRPPTADSPALSDSVYFACERQPYVVSPQPPAHLRGGTADSRGMPKKILTPSEFFALHVPGIISSLMGSAKGESGAKDRIVSAVSTASAKRTSATGSQHSRTKSAPLLGLYGPRVYKSPSANLESDEEVLKSSEIAEKVTKHRRSRSASGWAYPDRPRISRKVINV